MHVAHEDTRDCSPNSLLLHNQRWRLLVHRAVLKLESTLVSCILVGKRRKSCSDLWKSATVNLSPLYRANHRWPNFLMSLKISVWYDFFKVVSGIVLQACSELVLGCWSLFIPFLSRGVSVMFGSGVVIVVFVTHLVGTKILLHAWRNGTKWHVLQQAAINKCLKTQTASLPGLLCGDDTDSSFELCTFFML